MRNLLEWLFPGSDGEDADTGLHVVNVRQEALVKIAAEIADSAREIWEFLICSREE
jgi:hypothetical protein